MMKRVAIRAFFMHEYAREAEATAIRVEPAERPFSNFDFIDNQFNDCPTLARLMSQARGQGLKTIVVEELRASVDLKDENEDLQTATRGPVSSRAYRITFFERPFTRRKGLERATDQDIIGYAIMKKDSISTGDLPWRVYESVIKRSRHIHNYVRGEQDWICSPGGSKFKLRGYLYAEQNHLTNVCAHAALRTTTARFTKGGLSYRQMNQILGIDHKRKKASDGLNSDQMVRILEHSGARCFVGDFTRRKRPPAPFQKYIYNGMESGYPAIIFFGTTTSHDDYHVVPVFGHTFNQDTWVPTAERSYFGADSDPIPSDSWLSMFIAHDDNWGSNLCIPRHYLQTKLHPSAAPNRRRGLSRPDVQSVAYIIGTIPKQVELSPLHAEAIGADYLFTILPQLPFVQDNKWSSRLLRFAQNNQIVLRPLLITGEEYAQHLNQIHDWDHKRIKKHLIADIKAAFHNRTLWMIELSIPELFAANKRKLGEVLLRADAKAGPARDLNTFSLARLPGYFALYRRGPAASPEYHFVPSGAQGHVELFGCEESGT